MDTKDLVLSALSGDALSVKEAFDSLLKQRIQVIMSEEYIAEQYFSMQEDLYEEDDTYLSEALVNPAFMPGKKMAEFGELSKQVSSGNVSKDDVEERLYSLYIKHKSEFESIRDKYKSIITANARKFNNVKILTDMKSVSSLLDKITVRRKPLSGIVDIIRGAVILDNPQDAEKYVKDFQRKYGDKIVDLEHKAKGSDPTYGYYGTYHLLIDVDGIYCEIQIATHNLWKQKKLAHDIYTATRSSSAGVTKADSLMSKRIFVKGNRGGVDRPSASRYM